MQEDQSRFARNDRRLAQRRRTRLRAGRLFAGDGTFLGDCLVRDRTPLGVALIVPPGCTLPATLAFFDEERQSVHRARIAWRRGQRCGLTFRAAPWSHPGARGGFGGAFHALGAPRALAGRIVGEAGR